MTIVLSLYNERAVIQQKVQNFRELNYPLDRLSLAVGMDGCDDGTEGALAAVLDNRIQPFVFERRQGKTAVLNKIIASTNSDIVVFTDANAMFDSEAVRELVRPFADPAVGLVSGRSIVLGSDSDATVHNTYYRWLTRLKGQETESGSLVGADGAIYAMRRQLLEPLSPEFINDLTHPIQVVLHGARAILAPAAIAREPLDDWTFRGEFWRQVRMTAQAMHVVASFTPTLIRSRCLGYAIRLGLTKVLRWCLPALTVGGVISAMLMALQGSAVAGVIVTCLLVGLAVSLVGLSTSFLPFRSLAYALVVGAAYSVGLYKWAAGEKFITWQPRTG